MKLLKKPSRPMVCETEFYANESSGIPPVQPTPPSTPSTQSCTGNGGTGGGGSSGGSGGNGSSTPGSAQGCFQGYLTAYRAC